jgi:hypothetical protein
MTILDLLRSSFRLIGVLHPGQGPNGDDIQDGLFCLNSMLEAWSTERLNVFTVNAQTVATVAGKQTYQIGDGAPDWNQPRPIRIERANVLTPGASGPFELPLRILTDAEWAVIAIKSTASTLPTQLYNDGQFPYSNISLWPVPTVNLQIVLWVWQALQTGFTDTAADVSFPPGYAEAIRYNLACRLAPEWDRPIRPDVVDEAVRTKAAVKRLNHPRMRLGSDAALLPASGIFNWLTGK